MLLAYHNKAGSMSHIALAHEPNMKIYMLLMLVAVFVGYSYVPVRRQAEPRDAAAPDSVPAYAQRMSSHRV
jgi:hypothetical protein